MFEINTKARFPRTVLLLLGSFGLFQYKFNWPYSSGYTLSIAQYKRPTMNFLISLEPHYNKFSSIIFKLQNSLNSQDAQL